jgi:hypothetical protein
MNFSQFLAVCKDRPNDPDGFFYTVYFVNIVRKLKSKIKVKNPIAYFTGILNKKFQKCYFEELYEMQVC